MGKGKVTEFKIILNNQPKVYICGQNIDGYISVRLTEVLKTRGESLLEFETLFSSEWKILKK